MSVRACLAAFCAAALGSTAPAVAGDFKVLFAATPHDAMFDIAFDGDRGIAVGAGGLVTQSDDGGRSWHRAPSAPTHQALLGVSLSKGRGIAVGQAGTVLRLDDGQWSASTSGTDARLFAVATDGGDFAVAVGGFGTVLLSGDAGATWASAAIDWATVLEDAVEPHLYAVHQSGGLITIIGEFELVLQSRDRGATWTVRHQGEASLADLTVDENGRGLAVGQDGTVLRTSDRGVTWARTTLDGNPQLLGVWQSATDAVAVGIQAAFRSTDGGMTWTRDDRGDVSSSWYQAAAARKAAKDPVVVGHGGRIVAFGG